MNVERLKTYLPDYIDYKVMAMFLGAVITKGGSKIWFNYAA